MAVDEPILDCHINQAGDTYDVVCSCGYRDDDVGDLESAGELVRLHLGDDHCPDCGSTDYFNGDCKECLRCASRT